MGASKKIMALLALCDKKQIDLLSVLKMSSRQSLNNKFRDERWSAEDLVKIADFCGCKLAFILPSGQEIILDAENAEKEKPDV